MNLRHNGPCRAFVFLTAVSAFLLTGSHAFAQSKAYAPYLGSSTAPKRDFKDILESLHHSVCWINVSASQNGAGVVLDTSKRLVLTTRRVIRDAKHIVVYFPEKRLGKWEVDSNHYLRNAKSFSAKVITSAYGNDLALLQLSGLPVGATAVKLAPGRTATEDKLHILSARTKGTSLWTYNFGTVESAGRGLITNRWRMGIFVTKTFSSNHSRGEPVVNEQGHLIGIVEGSTTRDVQGKTLSDGRTAIRANDIGHIRYWLGVSLKHVNPQTAQGYLDRGKIHVEERRYDQALADLDTAFRRDNTLTKVHAQRGWAYYYKKLYKTAISHFDKAIQADSKDHDAFYGRGMANRMFKKKSDAMRDFTSAIAIYDRNYRYFNQRGILHYNDRKYREALVEFTKATALTRNRSVVYENKGRAALNIRSYSIALTAFQTATRLNPTNASYNNYTGVCHFRLKDYKQAEQKFRIAVKYDAKVPMYHKNLGHALQKLGRHGEAVSSYTTAIRVASYADSTMYHDRSISRIALKDYADAIRDLTTAIRKNVKYASAYYQRARAYALQGKTVLAKADLDKAKSLDKTRFGNTTLAGLTTKTVITAKPIVPLPTQGTDKLTGRWYFRQKLAGKDTEIELTMKANGSYTSKMTVFDANGRGKPAVESGSFSVKDEKLSLTPKVGKTVKRSHGFEGGKLWIYFAESKVVVYFDKK